MEKKGTEIRFRIVDGPTAFRRYTPRAICSEAQLAYPLTLNVLSLLSTFSPRPQKPEAGQSNVLSGLK